MLGRAAQRARPRASARRDGGSSGTEEQPPVPAGSASASKPAPAAESRNQGARRSEGPTACPSGMVLVEGDYCTDVDYVCKKSWYDKSNKKRSARSSSRSASASGAQVTKRYCIDMYTWPNEKGARPEVMNRFHQAQVKCAAEGKRLCSESEWTIVVRGAADAAVPVRLRAGHQQVSRRRRVGLAGHEEGGRA